MGKNSKLAFDTEDLRKAEKRRFFEKLAVFVGRHIHKFCEKHEFTYTEFARAAKHNYMKICQLVNYGRNPVEINPLTEPLLKKIVIGRVITVWDILDELGPELTHKELRYVKELAVHEDEELKAMVDRAKEQGRDHIRVINKYLKSQRG